MDPYDYAWITIKLRIGCRYSHYISCKVSINIAIVVAVNLRSLESNM